MPHTLLYTHAECLEHRMQERHMERPERLTAVIDYLRATGALAQMEIREPAHVERTVLAAIHTDDYLTMLEARAPRDEAAPRQNNVAAIDEAPRPLVRLDPDTAMGPGTLRAMLRAAGAVRDATHAVLSGVAQRAFCAIRPPGHHAEEGAAMGFCFYNNIALGAAVALTHPGIERVAVLDFDVHHGNGTVDIFKNRPEVLVCSSFQHPFYPNRLFDVARPNIVNTPLAEGSDGTVFRRAIERDWLPAVTAHRPQLILISAGFDAHAADPLGGLRLHEDDYAWVTRTICDWANEFSEGRVISALEGGYNLDSLARSAGAHIGALLDA